MKESNKSQQLLCIRLVTNADYIFFNGQVHKVNDRAKISHDSDAEGRVYVRLQFKA